MITTDELKVQLAEHAKAVKDLEEALAIEASRKRVQELEHTMSRPGFYDDADLSKKVFDEVGDLKGKLSRFEKLQGLYDDAETMLEMLDEEYDPAMIPEAEESVNAVGKAVDELQLMTMLNGEYDHSNAILTFHAGTGGTEAQDWAEMLYRMYNKWASNHGMTVEVLDYQDGDEAGMKSASMMVKGANAYGLLKSENGVHRLVRVSPFDANARRQTSFASLEVMPELDNTIQVNIRPEDIEMQVYRSSGAGGQHINKTSSAVRLIHKPTGVVVSCQTQRSQFQNRDYAMEMLKAKLYQIAKQQHMDKIDDIKGVQNEIAWGHQIRSYVFMPYTMVKDHRTNYETGNVDRASELLRKARQVYCLGQGGSMLIANDICARFACISTKFRTAGDSHLQLVTASLMTPEDVVLFVSYSGATRDMLETLRTAKAAGAKIILLTHYEDSPGAKLADVVLLCGAQESPLDSGNIPIKVALLYVAEVLVLRYTMDDPQNVMDAQDRTSEALAVKML